MDWNKIWNDIVNFFKTNAWNIVIFFAVLLLGIIVIKILLNITRRLLKKTKMEPIAVGFICAILKLLFYLCLVLILLSIIGIELTGLLTAISALLLAVGLALENNIAKAQASKEEIFTVASMWRDDVFGMMQSLRETVDSIEEIVDEDYWPIPSYVDLLFGI